MSQPASKSRPQIPAPPNPYEGDLRGAAEDLRTSHKGSRDAMGDALEHLDALDKWMSGRVLPSDSENPPMWADEWFELGPEDLRQYITGALSELAKVRDQAQKDIRLLVVLANLADTGLSTHALGRAANLSNSTVARWQKTPYVTEAEAISDYDRWREQQGGHSD